MSIFTRSREQLESDWASLARPSQLPPPGDWATWCLVAGRGFGKTRAGAEFIRSLAESKAVSHIALVAATASDCRDVMVEGQSGLLSIAPNSNRPLYEPTKRRLTWPNGVTATMFSSEESDRLRGPQFGAAWCDELAAWRNVRETWQNLQFALRLGKKPRQVVTTTPRPIPLLKELLKPGRTDVVITRGATRDNAENLAESFLGQIVGRYAGTRLGRQELEGELLEDIEGSLWSGELIEKGRIDKTDLPPLKRVVVAIDPAMTAGEDANETGLIVAGVDDRDHGYVLEDASGRMAPIEWARKAVELYHDHKADRIVAETNQGGALCEATIRMIDPNVSYRAVSASRGKVTRAEPCAALYEQGRVHHVGIFPELEDQLCSFAPGMPGSPDRGDALVWALTELLVENRNSSLGFLGYYAGLAGAGGAVHAPGGLQLERLVRVRAPPGIGAVRLLSGRDVNVPWDGSPIEMFETDAKPLLAANWSRVST